MAYSAVGGRNMCVTLCSSIAFITASASKVGSTTTVAPMASAAMVTGPAAWVSGAVASETGLPSTGMMLQMVSSIVPQLRFMTRTPFAGPVVPPVAISAVSSSGLPTGSPISGKVSDGASAIKSSSDLSPFMGLSRHTICLTVGTCALICCASFA